MGANYFQNKPYLDDFNKKNGTDIVPVATVHLEPLGVYSKKVKKLRRPEERRDGRRPERHHQRGPRAQAPRGRTALITLKKGVGNEATPKDVAKNPKNLKFKELEAAQVPRTLDDVDAAVINGNYALRPSLQPAKDAIVAESAKDNPYGNFLAVKKGNENDPRVKKLAKLLTSPEVKKFIEDKYDGAVVAAF